MSYYAKEINVIVPDSDKGLVTHPLVTLFERSDGIFWFKCENTPACAWKGEDSRKHWRESKHETYIQYRKVRKLQDSVPSPGIDATTGQPLTTQDILNRIAAL